MKNYPRAIQSFQRALGIAIELFGKEHQDTAECYFSLGQAQHASVDFPSALQSYQRALDIKVKLFGEEHPVTARCYFPLAETRNALHDFLSNSKTFTPNSVLLK